MENGKYDYRIKFSSQLGLRIGKFSILINDNAVVGFLHILGKSNRICGTINDGGDIRIEGNVKTLVRSFDFVGKGTADEDILKIEISEGKNVFMLMGERIVDTEE